MLLLAKLVVYPCAAACVVVSAVGLVVAAAGAVPVVCAWVYLPSVFDARTRVTA